MTTLKLSAYILDNLEPLLQQWEEPTDWGGGEATAFMNCFIAQSTGCP